MEKIGEENYALLLKRLVKQCKESEQTGGFEATVVKDDDFIHAYSVANQRLGLQNLVVGSGSAYTPAKMILGLLMDVTALAIQSGKPLEDRGVFAMQWASNEKVFQCYSMRIHPSQLHLFALGIECEKQLGLDENEYFTIVPEDTQGRKPWEPDWMSGCDSKLWEDPEADECAPQNNTLH